MPPVFSISPTTAEVNSSQGTINVTLSSFSGGWSSSTADDWLTVTPTEGVLDDLTAVVSYNENTGSFSRVGTITFTSELGMTATLTITQEAASAPSGGNIFVGGEGISIMLGNDEIPAIYCGEEQIYPTTISGFAVKPTELTFPISGGDKVIRVVSEYAWTASTPDSWLTLSVSSGASGRTSITVTAGPNETGGELSGSVVVTSTDLQHTATVDIIQQTSPIPVGYQELQYIIEPPATWAYIPTDIYLTSDMWFEYKVRPTQSPATPEKYVLSGQYYQPMRVLANSQMRVRRGQTSSSNPTATVYQWGSDTTFQEFKGNDDVIVNGTKVYTLSAGAQTVDTTKAWFFTSLETVPGTQSGSAGNEFSMIGWLYYFIIGSNTTGQELYHFVPVKRLSDNEVGLYEIVNGQFYGPGNNKKFTAGPAVE